MYFGLFITPSWGKRSGQIAKGVFLELPKKREGLAPLSYLHTSYIRDYLIFFLEKQPLFSGFLYIFSTKINETALCRGGFLTLPSRISPLDGVKSVQHHRNSEKVRLSRPNFFEGRVENPPLQYPLIPTKIRRCITHLRIVLFFVSESEKTMAVKADHDDDIAHQARRHDQHQLPENAHDGRINHIHNLHPAEGIAVNGHDHRQT